MSCDAKGRVDAAPKWVSCRPGFFLPVRVLSRAFRAKYRDGLRRLFDDGRLTLPDRLRLRRFVQHVLPKGFVKVRHYGLLANRDRDARLALCRRLLAVETLRARLMGTPSPVREERVILAPPRVMERVCPFCGGERIECRALPRTAPATFDSS